LNQLGTDGQTVYLDLSAYDSDLINAYEISDNLTFAGNWTTITPVDNLSLTALTYTFATPLTAERPLYVRVRDALGNISLPTSINVGPMATVWVQATGNAFSSARHYLRMESFNDELWAMGGHTTGATTNEVYHSENGTNWNLATTSNVWSEREVFTSEVFNNKLWVIGGNTPDNNGDVAQNDVWSSSDGISWDNSSATDRWSARWRLSSVVFDGKLWVMGGYNNGRLDDVWYSSDGISWDNSGVTDHWLARESHASVVFDGKIWVMGGNTASGVVNDVWSSSDGVDWVEELASNPSASHWSPRWEHNVLVFDNQIWLIGGTNSGRLRDIWKSSDGINWTEVVADGNTDFAASCCFGAAVHGNRMVIAGGKDTAGQQVNDVWYTTGTGVIAFSMRDNKTNVSLNPELWAELAYPIDNMTADFQNSVYLETEAGIQITGTVSSGVRVGSKTPTVDNRTIWFTPDSALDNATKYRFVITPAVKDKSGNSILKQNRTLQFTTQE
jgi:hypothetical protein